jgi:hypothetical protein
MYGQKVVRKGVQKAPPNPKSSVKQANCKTREGQKRVKNGPQKRHQKCTQKSSLKSTTNRPEIDFKVKIGPALKRVYSKLKLSAIFANFFKIE